MVTVCVDGLGGEGKRDGGYGFGKELVIFKHCSVDGLIDGLSIGERAAVGERW